MADRADPTALFRGVDTARASQSSDYDRVGHYIQRVDRVRAGQKSQNGEQFLAIEKTVIFTYPDTIQAFETAGRPAHWRPHVPGEQISHLMMRRHDSFLGNVKAAFSKMLSVPPDEITLEICAQLCDEKIQPLAQTFVEVRAREIFTRDKRPFTKVDYLRAISATELLQFLQQSSPETIERLFRDGSLQRLAAAEQSQQPR
jgi:hypothetical protein